MTIEQYARAIAEAAQEAAMRHVTCRHKDSFVAFDCPLDLDAIIASVPAPDVQALRGQIEGEVWEARRRVEAALSAEIVELRAQIERDAHAHHTSCFDGCETTVSESRAAIASIRDEARSWVKLDLLWEHRELLLALADVAHERCKDYQRSADRRVQAQIDAARAEERDWMENRLREVATLYSHGSDGRNTLLLLADQIRARSGARGA